MKEKCFCGENLTREDPFYTCKNNHYISRAMKEKDLNILRGLSMEQLVTMDETICMNEYCGQDVSELRKAIFDVINEKRPYAGANKIDLLNLRLEMHKLKKEGIDMSSSIEVLTEEIKRRGESGTIYDAKSPSPEVVRHD